MVESNADRLDMGKQRERQTKNNVKRLAPKIRPCHFLAPKSRPSFKARADLRLVGSSVFGWRPTQVKVRSCDFNSQNRFFAILLRGIKRGFS